MLEIRFMRLYQIKLGTWYVALPGNKRLSLKTKDKAIADRLFAKLKKEALLGNVLKLERKASKSLFTFRNEYLEYSKAHKAEGTFKRDRYSLNIMCEYLGDMPLQSIDAKKLDDFHTKMINSGQKPSSVNITIRHLRSAFQTAFEWEYLKINPYSRVRSIREEERPPRFLTEDEINRIIFVIKADQDFYDLITIYLMTGMRRSELCFLQVQDLDFNSENITIKKSKTKWRTIPMADKVKEILARQCAGRNIGRVFPQWKPDSVTHRWCRLMDKLKIDARLHDLRHTAASYLVMAGIDLRTVQEILGHTQISTTQIYSHLSKAHVKDALTKLEKWHNNSTVPKLKLVKG
jgi:integrase